MKKPFFIIRLGNKKIFDADLEAISNITDDDLDLAAGCPTPFGVVFIVMSNHTPSYMKESFRTAAKNAEDILPVVILDANSNLSAIDLCLDNVEEMIVAYEKKHNIKINNSIKNEINLSLDDLLDKVSRAGIDSLTEEEFSRLKFLSK